MSFTGNLNTVSFADLLQLISTSSKSGRLNVTKGNQQKDVYFDKGGIVFASALNSDSTLLGNLLLRKGRISKPNLERAISIHRVSGKKLGRVLVEMRLFNEEDITECLRLQIEEIVYSLFGWDSGEFVFYDGEAPPKDQSTTQLNTMNVIMEGTRRIDEWIEIQKLLPDGDTILKLVAHPNLANDSVKFTPEEYRTFLLINGERTLPEIVELSPYGEFITSKAIYKFIVSGLVEKGKKRAPKKSEKEEDEVLLALLSTIFSTCFSLIDQELADKVGQGKDKILEKSLGSEKIYHPLLGEILSSPAEVDMENFNKVAFKLPDKLRFCHLFNSLNSLLASYLETCSLVLGKNITRKLISELKKGIGPFISENKELDKKYGIEEDLFRRLRMI
ncbi:MAG: DUF4388 domain-containing protein [candidate division Zixibacteria bacterium]|nr:DUF4388 domain-containing protein [candidate division Zixibacteria bacterium]